MKRRKVKGLSIDKGQYVKAVGYATTKSGGVRARSWYVGAVDDGPEAALALADEYRKAWRDGQGTMQTTVNGETVTVWASDTPLAFPPASVDASSTEAAPDTSATPVGAMTVGAARDRYLDAIRQRYEAGQVSHSYYTGETFNLKMGVTLLGPDKPLSAIGTAEVTSAVLAIAARPLKTMKPVRKALNETPEQTAEKLKAAIARVAAMPPEPISVKTADSYLSSLRYFLDTMSKTEATPGTNIPLWNKPLTFDRIFFNNQPKLTDVEKDQRLEDGEAEADAFTIDELVQLFKRANDRQRLWMILALNCGFANKELATLTVSQVAGLDTDAPKIRRYRGKTDIYANWTLWNESGELLRCFIAGDNRKQPSDLVLLTEGKEALVEPMGMGRRDAVRSAWVNIVKVLPEDRQLSFKYLRKSGAKLIRHMKNIGGDAVAEMYLSHADDTVEGQNGKSKSVLKSYSGRDWAKLSEALVELRKQLQPMFSNKSGIPFALIRSHTAFTKAS